MLHNYTKDDTTQSYERIALHILQSSLLYRTCHR